MKFFQFDICYFDDRMRFSHLRIKQCSRERSSLKSNERWIYENDSNRNWIEKYCYRMNSIVWRDDQNRQSSRWISTKKYSNEKNFFSFPVEIWFVC